MRLHDLGLRADDQAEFPSELVRPELTRGRAPVLVENEDLAEADRGAVPVGTFPTGAAILNQPPM